MSGKDGGVQKILREKYQKALFFHSARHKLNLVVYDFNQIAVIRNTVTIIKEIIKFFRESGLRRKCVPNIPMFCEILWSQKYKSIAIFKEHYVQVVKALSTLSKDAEAESIADDLEADLRMPRITNRQTHRANPPAQTPSEFRKRSLMIPYLDSLILSLEQRFSEENLPANSLLTLHPHIMVQM
ncbi:unnamed protein product [Euphydryas editha]|uniref:Uncharacterized protein n=1 Tax=Euphydryas editha TaxID=104508 RepID=A0AAU9UM59_EUPED|nr:unnamed protein product [Euphydryas editha]